MPGRSFQWKKKPMDWTGCYNDDDDGDDDDSLLIDLTTFEPLDPFLLTSSATGPE